jgi:hypothetical protein
MRSCRMLLSATGPNLCGRKKIFIVKLERGCPREACNCLWKQCLCLHTVVGTVQQTNTRNKLKMTFAMHAQLWCCKHSCHSMSFNVIQQHLSLQRSSLCQQAGQALPVALHMLQCREANLLACSRTGSELEQMHGVISGYSRQHRRGCTSSAPTLLAHGQRIQHRGREALCIGRDCGASLVNGRRLQPARPM